jgi:hypothetical protein
MGIHLQARVGKRLDFLWVKKVNQPETQKNVASIEVLCILERHC